MTGNFRRNDIDELRNLGLDIDQPWQAVDYFEKLIAGFFGAPFAVATDCSTHALELCFRVVDQLDCVIDVPRRTYMSVPMMLEKIGQRWKFIDLAWQDRYYFSPMAIVDMSTSWKSNSYELGTMSCVSFQFKKHLPIGRGGMILLDDKSLYDRLQRLVRDGRDRTLLQHHDDVTEIGYHYFMTPEDAARGIRLFHMVQHSEPKIWSSSDYFDLTALSVFKNRPNAI